MWMYPEDSQYELKVSQPRLTEKGFYSRVTDEDKGICFLLPSIRRDVDFRQVNGPFDGRIENVPWYRRSDRPAYTPAQ